MKTAGFMAALNALHSCLFTTNENLLRLVLKNGETFTQEEKEQVSKSSDFKF